ncbi:MAG: CopG family transcriptional regulator [Deltaproteobacteria bacterium]|nr:CopG family transcriptional regulator [Deltaproteobacteria bacterium]
MRTIVDIPSEHLKPLKDICRRLKISRAEAIRKAITKYIQQTQIAAPDKVFGLWKNRDINARDYEDSLRNEWEQH